MNQIVTIGSKLSAWIQQANRIKDMWLESRIKRYADDVRARYANNRLSVIEKVFRPVITYNITGTVANLISAIRLLLAFIIFLLLYIEQNILPSLGIIYASLAIFVFASFLDLLDGPTARALNEISEMGKALDPFADKMLLAAVFIVSGSKYLPGFTYWSIIYLESFLISIAVIKLVLSRLPITMATQANMMGKIKNIVELVAGGFLFLCPFNDTFPIISNILFILAIPLAAGSIIGYLSSVKRK